MDPDTAQPDDRRTSLRKRTRRYMMIGYFFVVLAVCGISAVQVVKQVFFTKPELADAKQLECGEGIRLLDDAIDRARKTVHRSALNETQAVRKYRDALEPTWSHRFAIERACMGDVQREQAVRALIRLGHAEEHAVRSDAAELARLRKRTEQLVQRVAAPAQTGADVDERDVGGVKSDSTAEIPAVAPGVTANTP